MNLCQDSDLDHTVVFITFGFCVCRYGRYIPREFLHQGYQVVETSGLTNSCLFESASLVVFGYRRPNYLRLATLITGVPRIDEYTNQVHFIL